MRSAAMPVKLSFLKERQILYEQTLEAYLIKIAYRSRFNVELKHVKRKLGKILLTNVKLDTYGKLIFAVARSFCSRLAQTFLPLAR